MVSVIVPVYRTETTLDRCLQSIVDQTYTDIEVIVVNDGSPDNCKYKCDLWATRDKRIRIVHQENRGVSGARNSGIKKASGEFLMFVDSDDTITQNAIETLVYTQQKYNADLVIGSLIYTNGIKKKRMGQRFAIYSTVQAMEPDYTTLYLKYSVNHIYANLYRRKVLNGYFDERLKLGEDLEFGLRMYPFLKNIVFLDKDIYNYYSTQTGLTHRYDESKMDNARTVHQIALDFSKEYFSSSYLPKAENAVFCGDIVRAIQRLILMGNKRQDEEIRIIKEWLSKEDTRDAVNCMYKGSLIYFLVWVAIKYKMQAVLRLMFYIQKIVMAVNK